MCKFTFTQIYCLLILFSTRLVAEGVEERLPSATAARRLSIASTSEEDSSVKDYLFIYALETALARFVKFAQNRVGRYSSPSRGKRSFREDLGRVRGLTLRRASPGPRIPMYLHNCAYKF